MALSQRDHLSSIERDDPRSEAELLRRICHALAWSPSPEELAPALLRWIDEAIPVGPPDVRIVIRGPSGRLRTLASRGVTEGPPSSLHRTVLDGRKSYHAEDGPGFGLSILPMVSRGEVFGLIEVIAPAAALEKGRLVLEAVASQGAIALRGIEERSELRRRAEGLTDLASMTRALVTARSPEDAIRAAADYCYARAGSPVVGWLAAEGARRLELVAGRGLGPHKRRALTADVRILPGSAVDSGELQALAARFREVVGVPQVELVRAGEAVLVAGASSPKRSAEVHDLLSGVAPVLEQVTTHLSAVARAELRNQQLDLGIALTAHELREPLLGLRTVLAARAGAAANPADEVPELDELIEDLDGLLQWAVGAGPLSRRPTDLMGLVRRAVEISTVSGRPGGVTISGPVSAEVVADPGELRRAIANVVRNALVYSPPEEPVDVSVEQRDGSLVISVHDRGPGVPPEETGSVFDPFMRGRAGRLHRSGRGLGLFIARRIVEAHGGSIWVESEPWGATFSLEVPR